ncbi:uncharacterized protein PV06_09064 [Exophiala oligosperma]|uniref:Uncharacterized protein n=1 Tax=Exophiala oligosperma TaxID=215243 RepID=A0A0D2D800_9EURO|nr:uncharacterized protein PV06_09064 [Exophiala oligosperma]KIW39278.1 hypothetical protein PV06_09064 [Exophiala oligosperma]
MDLIFSLCCFQTKIMPMVSNVMHACMRFEFEKRTSSKKERCLEAYGDPGYPSQVTKVSDYTFGQMEPALRQRLLVTTAMTLVHQVTHSCVNNKRIELAKHDLEFSFLDQWSRG